MQIIESPSKTRHLGRALLISLVIAFVLALIIAFTAPTQAAEHLSTCNPIHATATVIVVQAYAYPRSLPLWVSVRTQAGQTGAFVTYRRFTIGQTVTIDGCRSAYAYVTIRSAY